MSNGGFSGQRFQTAARRRGGKPLPFMVECTVYDDDGNATGDEDVLLHVDPQLDTLRLAAAVGTMVDVANIALDEAPTLSSLERTEQVVAKSEDAKEAFGLCLMRPSRTIWEHARHSVDMDTLSKIVRWVQRELAGMDPTRPAESPDGSNTTSPSSTDGAGPAESTSDASPTPVL